MTDFSEAKVVRCQTCNRPFCDVEGPLCDCFYCDGCEEGKGGWVAKYEVGDKTYCEFCIDEYAEKCSFCGKYFPKNEMIIKVDENYKEYLICQNC